MPTTRQRFQITETDELAACLDKAALKWPDESRSKLLVRLAMAGAQTSLKSPMEEAFAFQMALDQMYRELGDSYHGVTLEDLRQDWPE
ncbi:MAG: hypothetical protein F2923_00085 [Actinobacteria bacterium]|uniref:Unannotated protein n=1 Tax=freshwater metagenome TaxID=449393 RepID=A0A6J7FFJ6_9ZZZZ|nr:hypothetical protein [Actinomycetota bacterium]MTB27022.1 hypothetical protein [Actinomycetota bacterium]